MEEFDTLKMINNPALEAVQQLQENIALSAIRKLQASSVVTAALKLDTTGAFAAARELQSTLNAVKSSMGGATAALEEYRKIVAPISESIKAMNIAYAPMFEQTRIFDSLNIKGLVAGLQTSASAMSAISGLNLSGVASIIDALPKYDFLSDMVTVDFSVDDAEKLYESGEITQDDINEEITEIVSKKQFLPKAEWDKIKKSKWFIAIKILIIIATFICKPVMGYTTDKALGSLGITEFWEESGVYDLIDSIFGDTEESLVSEAEAKATVDESKTGNISKQRREDLLAKIKEIRAFISRAPQDENTGNLLSYLSELEKDVNGKKYGLVFEEHREEIDEVLETHTPVVSEDKELFIDNGGQMNFLIEGDNLASLKLLETTHKGKIDLIYIDPPYNTGAKDWKYSNDYVDSNDAFRHSKWLSMMSVRLRVAKKLLSKNGALICAIDENEQTTTGLLLEDIFGEAYNIDCITVVHNPGGIQGANFSYCHEYAYFVYPRRSYYIQKERRESDDLTPFRDWGKENSKRVGSPNCFYPIITNGENILSFGEVPPDDFHPTSANEKHGSEIWVWPIDKNGIERRWRFAHNTVDEIHSELVVVNIRGELNIQRNKQLYTRKTVWNDSRFSANIHGTQLLSQIIDTKFPFPKSLYLVEECIRACEQSKNYTVLDFFAGSGTTGHAVMKLNAEDGGSRKFILCTNNENNICRDVTYERIKRIIDKEGYFASLKYYKVDYIPVSERMYYEYADELLRHIRELVELENGINFTDNEEIGIVLTEEDLSDFIADADAFTKCKKLYMGHDLLPSEEQEKALKAGGIEISIIPDYYYRDLQEA